MGDDGGREPAPGRWTALGLVLRNRNLRRLELAHVGSSLGDWAYATAIAVWAYQAGGAEVVGIWAAVRMFLTALATPFAAVLVDKVSRKRAMIASDVIRAGFIGAAAWGVATGAPLLLVLTFATLMSLFSAPFRVAQRSLMPRLARRPDELAAANGVTGTIDSVAMFLGPAIAAALLGVTSVSTVLLIDVATFGWSILLILGIRVPSRTTETADLAAHPGTATPDAPADHASPDPAAEPEEPFVQRTLAGFRYIFARPDLRALIMSAAAQTIVAGASAVFNLVMAYDIVRGGDQAYGYLESVLGVGCLCGGAIAIARARAGRLGSDFVTGVLLWSLPLVLVAIWPTPVTAFVCVALLGLGNPLVDVSFDTLLQRLTPDAVLTRVFGAMETMYISSMAFGAVIMPVLLGLFGFRWSMALMGVCVAVVPLVLLRRLRGLDRTAAPPQHLALWQGVGFLEPLAPAVIEDLAFAAKTRTYGSGDVILAQGSESDLFFVIESGSVRVTTDGRVVREEGPGEYFGEIGLLRDVPRTASVTALTPTAVQTIDRDEFLDAVLGLRGSHILAEDVVSQRLRA